MNSPGDDPSERPLPPPIYGTHGEEWQSEPEAARQFDRAFWIAAALVAAPAVVAWLL